jgi:hypothetical protein
VVRQIARVRVCIDYLADLPETKVLKSEPDEGWSLIDGRGSGERRKLHVSDI